MREQEGTSVDNRAKVDPNRRGLGAFGGVAVAFAATLFAADYIDKKRPQILKTRMGRGAFVLGSMAAIMTGVTGGVAIAESPTFGSEPQIK